MVRTGVDLIEIDRVEQAIARHGDRFLARVYTAAEQDACRGRVESLAARFAAKEAVGKALGCGIWRENVLWTDIEITRDDAGAPLLSLSGGARRRAELLGLTDWSVSLSHDRTRAIAFVVAVGPGDPGTAIL